MAKDVITQETEAITIPEPEDDGPSLRETLEKAYDDIEEGITTDDEPIEAASPNDRDDSGRFKSKQPEISGTDKAPNVSKAPVIESEPAIPSVLPPSSWAADAKEQFNQLPPRLQQEVSKRETDLRRYLSQETEKFAQRERTYSEIDQALAPRMPELQRMGVSPGAVVSRFMAWQNHLDTNPVQGLRDLAQSYGMDLRQLAEQEAQQPQEPAYVRELRNQVQQTQGLLQQFQKQTDAQRQAQIAHQLQGELNSFTQEKDAQGNLLRPHLEHVVEDMLPYVQHLRSTSPNMGARQLLQTAYDKAIWANPSTRELELKRGQAVADPVKSVNRAKQAAKLVNGEARGPQVPDRPDTLRGDLYAAWDKING